MKKTFAMCMAVLVALTCFSACGTKQVNSADEKLKIVSTIFPSYDFARQVCGDNAEVTMLLPPGAESHSYEPTPQDILTIQNCDLFLYVGGESDAWVDDVLSSLDKPVKTLKMMDAVDAVEEVLKEGMEPEEEEKTEEGEEAPEYDEHVWTAPANAMKIIQAISDAVCELDPTHQEAVTANTAAYEKKLARLDEDFREFFDTVQNKTFVVGDRFPLRYFADEYGLDYYAAFPGCSTETEPSAATVAYLIDKVKSEGLTTVFYIELSNHKVADSIAEATGAKTALFHTCHNVSKEDFANGATYLSLMRQNLATLKGAMH